MVFKKACVIGLAIATVVAMAQGTFVDGTHGMGRARTADGKQGAFRFELARFIREGHPVIGGNWWFGNAATGADHFEISLLHLGALNVVGRVAEFGGRAVVVRMTSTGPVRREGNLTGRVEDRKQPGGTGDPDKYKFRFATDNGGPVIEFDGLVTDGDIVVQPHH